MRSEVADEVRRRRKRRGWTPFKGPQLDAFIADGKVDEIGYGGAGGGGKTDLELGLALLKHRRSILYRRTFPQLAGIVERARDIYQEKGRYNESKAQWRLTTRCNIDGSPAPPVKRFVQFRSMQRLEDREKERGVPFDLRAWDEAQNFLKEQFMFAKAWTRTNVPGQHTTDLLCFNPPTTPEGLWLIDYFGPWLDRDHPNPAKPGEVRWFITMPDGKEVEVPGPTDYKSADYKRPDPIEVLVSEDDPSKGTRFVTPRSRTFFPALVTDNPVYIETGYMAVLDALPEPLRSQMRDGDFSAGLKDDIWQVIPTAWVRAAQKRWRNQYKDRPKTPDGKLVPLSSLGSDVAAGGEDQTVFSRRYTLTAAHRGQPKRLDWYAPLLAYPGTQTPDGASAAGLLLTAMNGEKATINIDAIGVGQGLKTALTMHQIKFNPVIVSQGSYETAKISNLPFANLKAQMYWRMREALDPENKDVEVALPDDRELLMDLCAARWSLTAEGITIEPKEETIKRSGRGLHKSEAVMLANHIAAGVTFGERPFVRK